MSQGTGSGEPPVAARQPEVRWDFDGAASHICDVANSEAGPDDVVLNFGVTRRDGDAPVEISVQMLRRISLRPLTAHNLRDMLRNVIADITADQARGRS